MRAQFAKTMLQIGKRDPDLAVLVGDIGAFGLREFAAQCPGRFYNAGIREQAMVSAAAGMALMGFVPVVHSIAPFVVERCFEQLKDDFCYHRLPGNVVSVGAGFDYAALGCTHHCYSDVAMLKSLPGTRVMIPGSAEEFDALFEANYRSGGLNYFRLCGRPHGAAVPVDAIARGKGAVLREGTDVTVAVSGQLLGDALECAEAASVAGISCEVVYFPTVKPFDADLLRASVRKTGRLATAEDHSVYGGLGEEAMRAALEAGLPARSARLLGVESDFVREYGSFEQLAAAVGVDAAGILRAVRELCRSAGGSL